MSTVVVTEVEVVTFEASAPRGLKGDSGEAAIPSSVVINREDGEISSLEFADGRTVTINREDGEIVSVDDGVYLKTIVREDGEITEIVVT